MPAPPSIPEAETSVAAQILQSISHGHEHREQVRATLAAIDVPAPDLSGLAWAATVGDLVNRERS